MTKHEAKWQTVFNKYLRETWPQTAGFYELKYTSTEFFSYKSFEDHQLASLLVMSNGGLVWKLSDSDPRKKPCDCISIPAMNAYVVIKYPLAFVIIEINTFVSDMDDRGRKLLSYEHAQDIAFKVIRV